MSEIIRLENIEMNVPSEDREAAIRRVGGMLVRGGYVEEEYIEGMLARDNSFSTYMGNMIALPHGENKYKENILSTGIAVVTYPDGIEWQGQSHRHRCQRRRAPGDPGPHRGPHGRAGRRP